MALSILIMIIVESHIHNWGFIAKSYQILKYISCFKKYIPY